MLTAAGSGYSAWRDIAITRWREDPTCDDWGSLRLPARHPRATRSGRSDYSRPARPATTTTSSSTRIARRSRGATATLATTLEVVVSAEDDAEVRRVTISNRGAADARDRGHLLCRAGAGPAGRRPGPSRLLQAVRRDRASGGDRRAGRPPPPARPGRARDLGRRTWPWSTAKWWASASSRPTGPASSAAASASARPPRSSTGGRYPDRPARCSTRSSPCGGACGSRPARRRGSTSGPWWRSSRAEVLDLIDKHHDIGAFERAAHAGLDPGAGRTAPSGDRSRPGRPVPAPGRPPDLRRADAAARFGHHPGRPRRPSRSSGASASPATCRSCWCASPTSTRSTWCARRC